MPYGYRLNVKKSFFFTEMRSTKDFRASSNRFDAEDLHRGTKLSPVKKSGKDRYSIYGSDEEDDLSLTTQKKESVFDYFDDGEDDR